MNTDKLNEALVELRHQRALLDAAISNIERVLKTLQSSTSEPRPMSNGKKRKGSYIDLGVKLLEQAGQPMHIKEIAKQIGLELGRNIPRASVESSFIRHIASFGKNARVVKVRPAYFTVPSLKHVVSTAGSLSMPFESLQSVKSN
jgi:HB1, ASXL, restriction endonuclease HTH domain